VLTAQILCLLLGKRWATKYDLHALPTPTRMIVSCIGPSSRRSWLLQGIATAKLPIGEFIKLASSQVNVCLGDIGVSLR
jgi:hypothetical protein